MNWRSFPLWPRSLASQLIALILAAIVISQLFTLWLFTDERRGALLEFASGAVVSRTAALVELLEETPADLHEQIRAAASSPLLYYWISARSALDDSGSTSAEKRIQQRLQREVGEARVVRTEVGRNITVPRYHRQIPPRRDKAPSRKKQSETRDVPLIVAMSVQLDNGNWLNMAATINFQRNSLIRIFVTVGIMAIAVIIIIAFTVRRLTRPLKGLAHAAERLGRGGVVEELSETGPPEIRNAIHAFNVMQERLTRFVQDRTAMLAAISHDLRTPITSLRIRAEFVEDEENRNRIIRTLDEMQRMVEATLAFAKDEANGEETSRVDLAEFLDAIVTDYQDMKQPVSLSARNDIGSRTILDCRPIAMKRALRNLIDNAVRYGGVAAVEYRVSEDAVIISIEDKGPGIPESRLEDVFEPFLRLESSRSEETGGIGLGLAIARSNIHAHGGTLLLKNVPEGGLIAMVSLPRS